VGGGGGLGGMLLSILKLLLRDFSRMTLDYY
jgi:hypothetical protein